MLVKPSLLNPVPSAGSNQVQRPLPVLHLLLEDFLPEHFPSKFL